MIPPVSPTRRVIAMRVVAPVLLLITLLTWGLASAVGASPDDDFHLASIWCGHGDNPPGCEAGDSADSRAVNTALVTDAVCFAFNADASAGCQGQDFPTNFDEVTVTDRGNFGGLYPPVFYWTMSWLVGDNIELSVLAVRAANVAIFAALVVTLFWLLPPVRRPTLVWSIALTFVPLSVYLVPSTNPSSWAVISAATLWIALIGYFETSGKRRVGLAVIALAATVLGAGARADAALFAILAIGLVIILTFRRERVYFLQAILPIVLVIIAGLLFLTARQSGAAVTGLAPIDNDLVVNPFTLAIANLVNLPSLWIGIFGFWPLGWLDTAMPSGVWVPAFAAFIGAVFLGLHLRVPRKGLVLAIVAFALVVFPVVLLVRSQSMVGANFQPRYLLPLMIILAGLLLLSQRDARPQLAPTAVWLVVIALSVANAIALHTQIRRYVTGVDGAGINLDSNLEWWWQLPITPMATWIVGSIAFATLLAIINTRSWNGEAPYVRDRRLSPSQSLPHLLSDDARSADTKMRNDAADIMPEARSPL